jgi:hypothetical protein
VLFATGEAGTPSKNPDLKSFTARASKQSASFNRSVVANKALQEAQLAADVDLKAHQTLMTKTKNLTRWLGLWDMAHRNRLVGPEIRIALTGDADGQCGEEAAQPARSAAVRHDSGSEATDGNSSSGEDQEEGNRAANKAFPLAHRCLSSTDVRYNDILESLLDRPRELTLLVQDEQAGFGEGLDLGVTYLTIEAARNEARAERLELVSGRKETETWKEVSASALPPMFKTFRKELVSQLTTRFALDTTPNKHVLLALKMNPSVNTATNSPQLEGKAAKAELMEAEYKRALRRQAIRQHRAAAPATATAPTPTAEPAAVPIATTAPATPVPPTTPVPGQPAGAKRRKGLLGTIATQHTMHATPDTDTVSSVIDTAVQAEMDRFDMVSEKTLAKVQGLPPYNSHASTAVMRCPLASVAGP